MKLSKGFKKFEYTPKLVASKRMGGELKCMSETRSRTKSSVCGGDIKALSVVDETRSKHSFMQTPLSREEERNTIQKALDRKQMSYAYHTTLPTFLKSQGPFAVYDHALHRGNNVETKNATVTE